MYSQPTPALSERQQFTIAAILVAAVMASLYIFRNLYLAALVGILAIPLFISHELAHKYMAKYFGYPASFQLDERTALLTAVSVILPIKFIAPGAMVVRGMPSLEENGKIALAGPIINIATSGILLLISAFFVDAWRELFQLMAAFSITIALFNLLPLSPILDGSKVKKWDERVFWVILVAVALIWLSMTPLFAGTSW